MVNRRLRPGWVVPASLLAVLLLTLALRLYRFPEIPPGLNHDEAENGFDALAILAGRGGGVYLPNNGGREPLQMYLEAAAMAVFGPTTFAIRFPSVLAATAGVLAVYLLGREWFGWLGRRATHGPALFAALFLTLMVTDLTLSRMAYRANWLPFFSALALLFLLRGLRRGRTLDFVLAGIAIGVGQYTYIAARFLPIAAIVVAATLLMVRAALWRTCWPGLAIMLLVATVAAAPLATHLLLHPNAHLDHLNYVALTHPDHQTSFWENAARVPGMFLFQGDPNWRHNFSGRPLFDPIVGALFVLGLAAGARYVVRRATPPATRGAILAAGAWVLIFLAPTALSEGAPNFLRSVGLFSVIVLFPALGLLLVLDWLRRGGVGPRWAWAVGAAVFLLSGVLTVKTYFVDFPNRLETYRYLNGDMVDAGIVIRDHARGPRVYVDTYFAGHASARYQIRELAYQALDLRRVLVIPAGGADYFLPRQDETLPAARLTTLLAQIDGERHDFADRFGRPLLTWIRKPAEAPVELARMGEPSAGAPTFGTVLRVLGASIEPGESGTERSAERPLPVMVAWRPLQPAPATTMFSFRVYDLEGYLWAQWDEAPGGATYPPERWSAGETIIERFALPLPVDQPPGRYRLALTVYTRDTLQAWPAQQEGMVPRDEATLAYFDLDRPAPAAMIRLPFAQPPEPAGLPGLTLLGHRLETPTIRPTEPFRLHLYWRAEDRISEPIWLALEWLDAAGQRVAERTLAVGGAYPTDRWQAGAVIHQVVTIAARKEAAPGESRFQLTLTGSTPASAGRTLPGPTLETRPRYWQPPPAVRPVGARLGDLAELWGYRLHTDEARAGAPLTVMLVWRARAETDQHYVVFVQLLDENGYLVAQNDRPPAAGAAPTRSWLPGEFIEDPHVLILPATLPAGPYHLIAGLYEPTRGARLQTTDGADFVMLATLLVRG